MRYFYLSFLPLLLAIPLLIHTDVEGITVLITGANRGLGLEFSKQLKEKGYTVIATARNPEKAQELKQLGVRVEQLDVADSKSIERLAKKLSGVPVDILINNAGVFLDKSATIETLEREKMKKTFDVNAFGPIFITQALLPNLREGKLKEVVNISSNLGSIENNKAGMYYSYRASKTALNQLMKTLSHELQKEGFTVIALHPGWVSTEMGGPSATYTAQQSVRKMVDVISRLDKNANGTFIDLNGQPLPW